MKILCLLVSFCSFGLMSFGQLNRGSDSVINKKQLIGVWQMGSPVVADALRKNIQFFDDGRFLLNYSQYDDITAVKSLGGHYKLDSNGIYLSVEFRKEIVGGTYVMGNPGVQKEEFTLEGGKLEIIKQQPRPDDFQEAFPLSACKAGKMDPKNACMILNYNTYYKLSDDPMAFGMRE